MMLINKIIWESLEDKASHNFTLVLLTGLKGLLMCPILHVKAYISSVLNCEDCMVFAFVGCILHKHAFSC